MFVISNACKYRTFLLLFSCPFYPISKMFLFPIYLLNFASKIVKAFSKGCNKNYPLIGKICKKNYLMK